MIYEKSVSLNELSFIFSEIFLGISLLFLILHTIFLITDTKKNYPILQNSNLKLIILILFFTLILNNNNILTKQSFFNNTIAFDLLTITSKQCIILVSIFILIIIQDYLKFQKINSFEYLILCSFSIFGLIVLCSSNDLITAYLSIEVQSLSFYLLSAYKKNSIFSTESGLKYFILGAFSSSLFLLGSSLLYGITGSTNFEDFSDLIIDFKLNESLENKNIILLDFSIILIIISLFFKLALAPFHIWSPDIYEGSPSSSTALFALIPKIGLFVLLTRLLHYSFSNVLETWKFFIVFIAILSVIVGSFTGLEQRKLKSLLAYSSISHMGYSLLAFSSGTINGILVLFCYLIVYILTGLCIWSIFLGLKSKQTFNMKQNKDLTEFSGLVKSNKTISIIFAISLLSLAGFPPLIGFFVKLNIFFSAIESSMYLTSTIIILCSVISTFYYIRLIKIIYFEQNIQKVLFYSLNYEISIIICLCFFFLIFLFLFPEIIYLYCYKMCFIF